MKWIDTKKTTLVHVQIIKVSKFAIIIIIKIIKELVSRTS